MIFKKRKPKVKGGHNPATRALLGILFLVMSIFIAFFALPFFYEARAGTENVCIAAHDINKGDIIESRHLHTKVAGTFGLDGYFVDKTLIIGNIATSDIAKGDIIFENKIAGKDENVLLFLPADGRGLLTITVKSNAAGLASHIRKGSIVNVYNIIEITNEVEEINSFGGVTYRIEQGLLPVLNPLLENMEVYSIENSTATELKDKGSDPAISENPNTNAHIVTTITFFTTSKEQELELLKAEYDGIVHVSLVGL